MILFFIFRFFSIWLLSFNHIVFAIVFFLTFFRLYCLCADFSILCFFSRKNNNQHTNFSVFIWNKLSQSSVFIYFWFVSCYSLFIFFFYQKNSIRILNVVWLVVLCALPVIEYLHMVCVNLLFYFSFSVQCLCFSYVFSLVIKSLIFEFLAFSRKQGQKNQTFRMYWKCFGLIAV